MTRTRERPRDPIMDWGKGRTKQSMAAECDINNIMAKYQKTGLIEHVTRYKGNYTDLPAETDYQTNLQSIMDAEDAFNSLSSDIRRDFDNDPGKFLAFVQNPENQDAINEYGLGPDYVPFLARNDPEYRPDSQPEDAPDVDVEGDAHS